MCDCQKLYIYPHWFSDDTYQNQTALSFLSTHAAICLAVKPGRLTCALLFDTIPLPCPVLDLHADVVVDPRIWRTVAAAPSIIPGDLSWQASHPFNPTSVASALGISAAFTPQTYPRLSGLGKRTSVQRD